MEERVVEGQPAKPVEEEEEEIKGRSEAGQLVKIECAFCKGRGIYHFGHPPSQAKCSVCSGRGEARIRAPYKKCPACNGTGAVPGKWMSCITCGGKGVVHVRE